MEETGLPLPAARCLSKEHAAAYLGIAAAHGLDPAQMVTLELHELAPISLYSYQARAFAPSLQATRMLAMLPRLLHEALQGNGKQPRR